MRVALLVLLAAAACSSPHPKDVGAKKNPRSEFGEGGGGPTRDRERADAGAPAAASGTKARVIAHASSYAIATDAERVYFGDAEDDGLFAVAKTGGERVRLARRAPTRGGLTVSAEILAWIATPGDTVLRSTPKEPDQTQVVRQAGIFAQLVESGGDILFTEAVGAGGALTRVTGTTAAKLATFEGAPRGLAIDATHAFIATPARLLRVPRERGEVESIATGMGFASVALDEQAVLVTTPMDDARAIVRVPKTGGPPAVVARGVGSAPIAVFAREVFHLDAAAPILRATSLATGATRIVSSGPMLERVTAMHADASGVYLATGEGEAAQIVAVSR